MARGRSVLAFILHLGLVVIASSVIPLALGIWADRRFEMAPWLTLAGTLVGVTVASVGIWQVVRRRYIELERRYRDRGSANDFSKDNGELCAPDGANSEEAEALCRV
jgi:F0F1-type ATP synthase assembly protein I